MRKRWNYLRDPRFNPPNLNCPECTEPSKTYEIGSRTEGGKKIATWACSNGHRWLLTEDR